MLFKISFQNIDQDVQKNSDDTEKFPYIPHSVLTSSNMINMSQLVNQYIIVT